MRNFYILYKITYYDDFAERTENAAGVVYAENFSAAIEKLDRQTNLVTIIEVFAQYNNWLCSRMRLDPELTPELVNLMTKYQDIFINEHSNTMVEFK